MKNIGPVVIKVRALPVSERTNVAGRGKADAHALELLRGIRSDTNSVPSSRKEI
jgi:hypothetical protein